jgi:hypothetical protein
VRRKEKKKGRKERKKEKGGKRLGESVSEDRGLVEWSAWVAEKKRKKKVRRFSIVIFGSPSLPLSVLDHLRDKR